MKTKYRRMLRGMKVQEEQIAAGAGLRRPFGLCIYLECADGSYYTGVTIDLDRRLRQHQEGTASRYTRIRRPVVLVHREECGSRSLALSRECAVKSLSRSRKEELVRGITTGKARRPQE